MSAEIRPCGSIDELRGAGHVHAQQGLVGGAAAADLVRASQADELTRGVVARADALLATDVEPWCPEIF